MSAFRYWRGFRHEWLREVLGFRLPHRISRLHDFLDEDGFHFAQSTGVDGNFMPGSHLWTTQVGEVKEHHAVLLTDIPEFVIPVKGRGGIMGVDPAVGTVGGPTADPIPDWMADGEFAVCSLLPKDSAHRRPNPH